MAAVQQLGHAVNRIADAIHEAEREQQPEEVIDALRALADAADALSVRLLGGSRHG